ncbi:hypothetical protein EJV47_14455 [Hymenobacter gummosus]|uniref:MoxR-vWA-beta-propeller ternary system domain-containing protein n=1 Tax=Hymenobacter gummosus TaxID=1776032 RepID=A0A3S0H5H5_9BACT|nr:hypothetical protein [Hymenobacter gummosus]RTQ48804.1 hypothetical protein EJV47_14455 [Hymenobacter gummosus]
MSTPASLTERVLVLAADLNALAEVRPLPGLRAAAAPDGRLWLRGLPAAGELPLALRRLPAAAAYVLDATGRLFPPGRLTPVGQLPALSWQPLPALLPVELPTAALPAQGAPTYPVRLLPSARAEPGAALLTTLPAWLRYAEAAPEIRLRALRFAAAADGRVLVQGEPLPALPGQEHWQPAPQLLLPAGFAFESPLLAQLLPRQLHPAGDALLLFAADGSWEPIPLVHLQPATRSAVRLTARGLRHE